MKKFNSLYYTGLGIVIIPTAVFTIVCLTSMYVSKPVVTEPITDVNYMPVAPEKIIVHDTVFLPAVEDKIHKKKVINSDTVTKKKINLDTLQLKDTI